MKPLPKILTLLYALCAIHSVTLADNITVQGEVSGEWNTDTVLVTGDLNIPDGESLLIQPGTVVRFMGSYEFDVEGTILASGYEKDSIWFQMADTTGFMTDSIQDGGWKGIRFSHNRNSNPTSEFYLCRFSYGKNINEDPLGGNGGAMSVRGFSKVMINECRFTDNYAIYNGGALALDSASINLYNSVFERNRSGLTVAPWGYGGAVCSDNSNPEIRWNVFTNNSSTGVGGGLSVRYQDCNVYNNIFTGNVSGLGGGLCMLHIAEINYRVNNNLIADNYANFFGGGVASLDASPFYINNTIVYNHAMYGGGFYCKDSISPDFYNTIFWGNTAGVGPTGYLFEVYSQADFFNCDVQYGPSQFGGSGGGEAFFGSYEQCIDLDPEFLGYGDFPYQLDMDSSPCIDSGTPDTSGFFLPEIDLAYLPRIWSVFIDMGAYEAVWEGLPEDPGNDGVKVWPNPTSGKFQITSTIRQLADQTKSENQNKIKKIEVLDLNGNVLLSKILQSFCIREVIDISQLSPGIYLARITLGNSTVTRRIVKVSHR